MSELTSTTGFLDVQTASLYYEVAGEGYPLLLLGGNVVTDPKRVLTQSVW